MELLAVLVKILAYFFLWMILGRLALQVVSLGRRTVFTGVFELATAPVVWLVRRLTPRSVGDGHIPVLSLPLLLTVLLLL
jgi:uncharacterized protein YggT (Ycf19 family)